MVDFKKPKRCGQKLLDSDWTPASYEFAGRATVQHVGIGAPLVKQNSLDISTGVSRSAAEHADGSIVREAVALRDRDVVVMGMTRRAPKDSICVWSGSSMHSRGNQADKVGGADDSRTISDSSMRVRSGGGGLSDTIRLINKSAATCPIWMEGTLMALIDGTNKRVTGALLKQARLNARGTVRPISCATRSSAKAPWCE